MELGGVSVCLSCVFVYLLSLYVCVLVCLCVDIFKRIYHKFPTIYYGCHLSRMNSLIFTL